MRSAGWNQYTSEEFAEPKKSSSRENRIMNQSQTNFLPFHMPLIEEDDIRAVRETMESGWITTGPRSMQFEREFGKFVGARNAIAVNSGTAALHVALEAAGIGPGDEVIVPTLTFAATAEAVLYRGARPVLVDCESDTFNIDPLQVESAITPRTRAIIPVHFGGHPCEMDQLQTLARRHQLVVIEDAAHALSARYRGRAVGTLGDITCFSFYATKNITTGEGGMATTENDEWADRMRIMRLHGISKDAWKRYSAEGTWRYEIIAPGFKYNLTDMQASLGLSQLAKCNKMWGRRSELAQRYTDALSMLEAFEVPSVRHEIQHAWHLYVIQICPGVLHIHRDQIIEELKTRGIGTSVHFIPLHTHPYYRDTWGYRNGDFPIAEDYFDRCISLPLYPAMTDEDQERVIDALTEIVSLHRSASEPIFVMPQPVGIPVSGHASQVAPIVSNVSVLAPSPLLSATKPAHDVMFSTWYRKVGKRLFDAVVAAIGLLAASPVLLACAIAVRLTSSGPIFFRHLRVGKEGQTFKLLKFRTMFADSTGPSVTAAGDLRITGAGRWLRKWKLDELPQLVNVLFGDMSLVGPRPEVPEYVAQYSDEQREVFNCRPGITSPASIAYIDEEQLLAAQKNREEFYVRVLLPRKSDLNVAYCRTISPAADFRILLNTARSLFHLETGREKSARLDSAISGRV
jgi:dTDP-4-amino-4,6-dideoxygalactose transaminase/lipopolysaccharide/colanic/teichoic acid biosynthesis glycosyltransferase